MTRRLRFAALAAVVALAFSACANNDAKESDVVNAMEDAGLETEQAECIGQRFDEEFGDDQDLFNDIASATDVEDFPEDTQPQIEAILAECIEGETPAADEDEDADTSSTTAADDASTTTTAAG
jgi:hypothetical protein